MRRRGRSRANTSGGVWGDEVGGSRCPSAAIWLVTPGRMNSGGRLKYWSLRFQSLHRLANHANHANHAKDSVRRQRWRLVLNVTALTDSCHTVCRRGQGQHPEDVELWEAGMFAEASRCCCCCCYGGPHSYDGLSLCASIKNEAGILQGHVMHSGTRVEIRESLLQSHTDKRSFIVYLWTVCTFIISERRLNRCNKNWYYLGTKILRE